MKHKTKNCTSRRRVDVGRKQIGFPVNEETLAKCIKERNSKGLKVKDKFIEMEKLDIADRLDKFSIETEDMLEAFQESVA